MNLSAFIIRNAFCGHMHFWCIYYINHRLRFSPLVSLSFSSAHTQLKQMTKFIADAKRFSIRTDDDEVDVNLIMEGQEDGIALWIIGLWWTCLPNLRTSSLICTSIRWFEIGKNTMNSAELHWNALIYHKLCWKAFHGTWTQFLAIQCEMPIQEPWQSPCSSTYSRGTLYSVHTHTRVKSSSHA